MNGFAKEYLRQPVVLRLAVRLEPRGGESRDQCALTDEPSIDELIAKRRTIRRVMDDLN
jgi:hypothetical protein